MPATFESFGLRFLYPDNWQLSERAEEEGDDGVTLELPGGGFFSLQRDREGMLDEELIEEVSQLIESEYDDVEREEVAIPGAEPDERAIDFRFYYLDLMIVSRLILLTIADSRYLVQFQAESRDFDANELVLAAILKQLRD